MSICLDHESFEYQSLKNRTDIPGFHFDAICSYYLERYGRFPKLDEIPNTNSINVLNNKLGSSEEVSDDESGVSYHQFITSKEKLKKLLGIPDLDSLEQRFLEQKFIQAYPDLDLISFSELNNEYTINVRRIASKWFNRKAEFEQNENVFSIVVINNLIEKAIQRFGRKIYKITDLDLASPKWNGLIDRSKTNKAFIYNGDIYINVDHATIEDTLHEFLHLILGSIEQKEGEFYYDLISRIASDEQWLESQLPMFYKPGTNQLDRSMSDILEELFVREMSKYLTGQKNKIREFESEVQNLILNDFMLGFNQIFDANYSIDVTNPLLSFQTSLIDLGNKLESTHFSVNLIEESTKHRINSNLVSKYLQQFNNIQELCS